MEKNFKDLCEGKTGGAEVSIQNAGYERVTAQGWTWQLGVIRGTSQATNTWNDRLQWVATSQLTNCRN